MVKRNIWQRIAFFAIRFLITCLPLQLPFKLFSASVNRGRFLVTLLQFKTSGSCFGSLTLAATDHQTITQPTKPIKQATICQFGLPHVGYLTLSPQILLPLLRKNAKHPKSGIVCCQDLENETCFYASAVAPFLVVTPSACNLQHTSPIWELVLLVLLVLHTWRAKWCCDIFLFC